MKLLIKGGHLTDPANSIDREADLLIEDGLITAVKKGISAKGADQVIEADGFKVLPGFIDLHTHLREPGYEYKEEVATGVKAAVAGGFTAVCCMANTLPVADTSAVLELILAQAGRANLAKVYPIGAITKGLKGQEISEMQALAAAGAIGFSDDGRGVQNSRVMRMAMQYSRIGDWLLLLHEEDDALAEDGQMHEGFYSTYYGLRGIPDLAEDIMVKRDIALAADTGARVHFCHVSTAGSLRAIKEAKTRGLRVTCEVTPHHLTLTDEMLGSYDSSYKVNPPLRSGEHVEALINGLADGSIDAIATDHAPHDLEVKHCEFAQAANGISGLETAVAVVVDQLVKTGILSWGRLAELMSTNPAKIIGVTPPALIAGGTADITIIDPQKNKKVDVSQFNSKGKNNPYQGREMTGWPVATIVNGQLVYYQR
ncbi:MAG: dihydroorotase [Methylocystaceae bacterium]